MTDFERRSIVNPNAVIVEGPGYTGPDGRSIMPDYRDPLSVGELVRSLYLSQECPGLPT